MPAPKAAAKKKVTRRKILRWGFAGGLLALGIDAKAFEPTALVTESFEYPIRGLASAFDGYRIAFITDIHFPRNIDRSFIQEVVKTASDFNPDLLLYGGDFVDDHDVDKIPSLEGLFEATAPDGVYGVLGNHDWEVDGPWTEKELHRTSPMRILKNEHVYIRRGDDQFCLGGMEDLWHRRPDLSLTFEGVPEEVPRILVSHNPDTSEKTNGSARVDLQLSGHTHGGEVDLPIFGPPMIPSNYGEKFKKGLVQGALHPVYVSRGIASPRGIRFNCRPEVTLLTLRQG